MDDDGIERGGPRPVRDGLDHLVHKLTLTRVHCHQEFDDNPELCAERRAVLADAVRWFNAHHRGRR